MQKDDDLKKEIIGFWFSDEVKTRWFNSSAEFDELLKSRYEKTWGLARAGSFDHWEQEAQGALALVIILDQFPLNMFRQDARSYSTEAHAREISRRAIEQGLDQKLIKVQQAFMYLPFMHSESIDDQELSVALFKKAGLDDNLRYARHHRDVVRQFGRFPHRNIDLGRDSTQEEIVYLAKASW